MESRNLLDGKINYIMTGLIDNKFPDDWGVAVEFSRNIYDDLKQIFFKNNCLNIFYFNIFIKEILPEDLVIYISKIFFNFFINNTELEEASDLALTYLGDSIVNEITSDFFVDPIPQMKLDYSVDNGFTLNIECYTYDGDALENYISLSSEETYKYLKIILNIGVRIYDILYQDIFEVGYRRLF